MEIWVVFRYEEAYEAHTTYEGAEKAAIKYNIDGGYTAENHCYSCGPIELVED